MLARICTIIDEREESFLCYSKEEYEEILESFKAIKPTYSLWEDTGSYSNRYKADLQVHFFKNNETVKNLMEKLTSLGYTREDFFGKDIKDTDQKLLDEDFDIFSDVDLTPFVLKNKKQEEALETLQDLPDKIVEIGKSLIKVKRYKGLGEMNAEELWDTTMDPARRRLRRVTIEERMVLDQHQKRYQSLHQEVFDPYL